MQGLTRIVAAVVDTTKAVLYKEDGTVVEILQGDDRLRPILELITPLLTSQGYADIDLSTPNSWKEFEEKSQGGFRFFKIAKEKLKNLFGAGNEPVPTMVAGILPSPPSAIGVGHSMSLAVEEIMKNAIPVRSQEFNEDRVAPQRPVVESNGRTPSDRLNEGKEEHFDKHEHTIVAVTPTGKLVPGIERIKSQFAAAVASGSTKGLEVFMTRIAKVIEKRQHTVEDLLRFMERGDLPIAEDGSIVIYKRLCRSGPEHYVDAHSRKVRQRVGSYVYMDADRVDPNRRNECSNGLHVARRGYIGNFSGDVVVLAKVRPEDVVAVPEYDANKMRVCGYHIIAELTPIQFRTICDNQPIQNAEGGAELLGKAIAGDHVGILEHVKIGGEMGANLQITPQKTSPTSKKAKRSKKKAVKKAPRPARPTKALEAGMAKSDAPVNVKHLVARQKDASVSLTAPPVAPLLTQAEEVQAMWADALGGDQAMAQKLLAFKKEKKKGWAVWGLDPSAGDTLKALIKN